MEGIAEMGQETKWLQSETSRRKNHKKEIRDIRSSWQMCTFGEIAVYSINLLLFGKKICKIN